jgi:hypothetical protein
MQRHTRLTHTSVTARSPADRSRTHVGRRPCSRACAPHTGHQPVAATGTLFAGEEDAMHCAVGLVDQMRRDGAAYAICCMRVRLWTDSDRLVDGPPLYRAPYYDLEQGLTDAEVFAARVHDFHEFRDRWNRNHAANNSPGELGTAPGRTTGDRAGIVPRVRSRREVPRTLKPVHDLAAALRSGQRTRGRGNPLG